MVIATILLTVLGVGLGLILNAQQAARGFPASGGQDTAPVDAGESRTPCRPETQQAAARAGVPGVLVQVLKVVTKSSTVWICEDSRGRYYYHANRGGEDAPWVENKTALFLNGVQRNGDTYTVTVADGTQFSVNRQRLLILHADGRREEQPAV
ncbi:hypothetical protein GCM10012284_41640 [Mangrovihabitans endophyticus]|uniref:Uncharacterized protein n=1 Tax=Mangrovihabitans endophyticus TaxID=1751298 RepID=A0A8J3FPX5_9ACTN|nr:hypothetical protein GCM10012284_41640 [Mangrovihabitans endophyticus]